MAASILSPNPHLLCSVSLHSKLSFREVGRQQPSSWPRTATKPKRQAVVGVSIQEPLVSALVENINNYHHNFDLFYVLADTAVGYSLASYYTSLGLFVISVPGLWSLIKRSVKSKV